MIGRVERDSLGNGIPHQIVGIFGLVTAFEAVAPEFQTGLGLKAGEEVLDQIERNLVENLPAVIGEIHNRLEGVHMVGEDQTDDMGLALAVT